jgi:hypothetical protein
MVAVVAAWLVRVNWTYASLHCYGASHHLGAQTAGGRLVPFDAVCEDTSTSTSAFLATQPLYKTCYRRFWLDAKIGQLFIAQKISVATMEASHMHDKFDNFHDQSSSASRVTAGAVGFLTLTQQSLRPGR